MLKVLLVAPTMGAFGGIEAFCSALAAYLSGRADFEVRLLFKLVCGCRVQHSLRNALAERALLARFCQRGGIELGRAIQWADVVHANNFSPDVALFAFLDRKPLVCTMHNRRPDGVNLHVRLWEISSRLARRRYYNSAFVAQSWEPRGLRPGTLVVPTVSDLRLQFAPIEQRRGFVFISRWIAGKGADILIEAYLRAGLDSELWPLHMLGDGPLRPELEHQVQREGPPGIYFHGFVTEDVKQDRIGMARWMVAPPHLREDMGLTPLEARARGVPCIVTRDGGLPEVAGTEAIVCEPGSVESLASALRAAAAMSADTYAQRSIATHESLKQLLQPMSFYPEQYSEVLSGVRG